MRGFAFVYLWICLWINGSWAQHPVLDLPIKEIRELAPFSFLLERYFKNFTGRSLSAGEVLTVRHLLQLRGDNSRSTKTAEKYLKSIGLGFLHMTTEELQALESVDFSRAPHFSIEDLRKIPLAGGAFQNIHQAELHALLNRTNARNLADLDRWTLEDLIDFSANPSPMLYAVVGRLTELGYTFRRRDPAPSIEDIPSITGDFHLQRDHLERVCPRLATALFEHTPLDPQMLLWDLWELGNNPPNRRSMTPTASQFLWMIDRFNRRHGVFTLGELVLRYPLLRQDDSVMMARHFARRADFALIDFVRAIDTVIRRKAVQPSSQCTRFSP